MMDGFAGMSWWGPIFGGVMMILWWGLIIFGIIALVRWLLPAPGTTGTGLDAMNILRQRYAKGEIDRDQFEQLQQDIRR